MALVRPLQLLWREQTHTYLDQKPLLQQNNNGTNSHIYAGQG
jgi:hypothetical protein